MEEEKKFDGGGPAFPTHENANDPRSDGFYHIDGMTLWDYFLGQILASGVLDCKQAMRYADEMLVARNKRFE